MAMIEAEQERIAQKAETRKKPCLESGVQDIVPLQYGNDRFAFRNDDAPIIFVDNDPLNSLAPVESAENSDRKIRGLSYQKYAIEAKTSKTVRKRFARSVLNWELTKNSGFIILFQEKTFRLVVSVLMTIFLQLKAFVMIMRSYMSN